MFNIFWIHIRNWDHVWYKFFLEILNVSGSIGYPFRFGFGSDNTHNPKYHKTRSIRFLCRVRIGSDSFLSGRVRFGFSGSVYFPSPSAANILLELRRKCLPVTGVEEQNVFWLQVERKSNICRKPVIIWHSWRTYILKPDLGAIIYCDPILDTYVAWSSYWNQ